MQTINAINICFFILGILSNRSVHADLFNHISVNFPVLSGVPDYYDTFQCLIEVNCVIFPHHKSRNFPVVKLNCTVRDQNSIISHPGLYLTLSLPNKIKKENTCHISLGAIKARNLKMNWAFSSSRRMNIKWCLISMWIKLPRCWDFIVCVGWLVSHK